MAKNISRRKRDAPITPDNPKRQQISHHESSDSSSEDERDFGQRTPPLIDYIKGILNSYPDGSQILKEIIQNADDAGATEVAFLLDYTKHSCDNLIHPVCSLYQGEALYSWNNAKFKKLDWEGIRNIGISGKVEETLKVGRFGLGFVAVYHITDVPMILSYNSIGILDPQQQIYPNEPGKRIKLKKFFRDPAYSAHQNCFRYYFDYEGSSKYDGTIFRFPLRNAQSKSKIKPTGLYTAGGVMTKLFKPLQEEASNILIFLKNVKSITLYTRSKSGLETKKIFSIKLPDNYIDDVVYSNRLLSNHVEQRNFHKSIKVTINLFPISSLDSKENTVWLVLNMIGFPQSHTELYQFYSKSNLNYLPWIGIAMETGITCDQLGASNAMNFQEDWDGDNILDFIYRILEKFTFHFTVPINHRLSADSGKLFCFLPTPEPTDLPFNLHGYFALSNDRRQIKWPSVDSNDTDSIWNKLLVEQLGVSAFAIYYSILINSFHHDNPDNYHYQMLGACTLKKQSSILIDQGLRMLANEKIVYSYITNEWIKSEEGIYISDGNTKINKPIAKVLELLEEPLVLLPTTILTLFTTIDSVKNAIDRRKVTPTLLRQLLRKHSNYPALNAYFIRNLKEHTFVILNFILSDFTTPNSYMLNQLDSIPLLKVATRDIFNFSINPKTFYYIYDDQTFDFIKLFPGTEGSFVDRCMPPEIYSRLLTLSQTFKGKINLKDISNIKTDLHLLKHLFKLSIQSHFTNSTPPLKWNPNLSPFNKAWIKLIWSLIGSDENLARSLGALPLLPKHDLSSINNQLLPIVSSSNNYILSSADENYKTLENILLQCGCVFIHSHKFIECLSNLILKPIPDGLLSLLQVNSDILNIFIYKLTQNTNQQLFEQIIEILNNNSLIAINQIQLIKKLPIFPTMIGNHISISVFAFVRVPTNINLPPEIQYPENYLSPDIYSVNMLYGKLGITAPEFNNFLNNNILPFMRVLVETSEFVHHFNLSKWLLSNLDRVSYQNIKILKNSDWIVDNSSSISRPGSYRKPNELFYPDDDMLKILLPSKSKFFVHEDYKDYFHIAKKKELFLISAQLTDQKLFEQVTQSSVEYFYLDVNAPDCNVLWKKRFSTLLQFVTSCWKSKGLNIYSISRTLLSSNIVLPSFTRPDDYPKRIPFLGKRKLTEMQSVVFCNDADIPLIASVRICVPFFRSYQTNQSNELLTHLKCNTSVTGKMMAEQLNRISQTIIQFDSDKIHPLLNRIYSLPSILTVIGEIVPDFVYVKYMNSFIEAKLVARNLDYSLEPFYYSFEKLNYSNAAWKLFEKCGASESLSDNQLYQILHTLYQSQEVESRPHNVELILKIIQVLYKSQTQSFDNAFLLGVDELLHLASDCVVYDNPRHSSKMTQVNKNDKMYFIVNSNISKSVASKFGAKSFKLTMLGNELGFLKYTGQYEELTTRLRSILKEYESNIDVCKELLQNADDANANTVCILIDYNSFPTDSLIEPTMEQWQGPALYFYNDAQFTNKDFENIMKIFGETKLEDKLKIGKYGLGFNTVYHLTDLPSFVSGRYIHMLDPNRKFLVDPTNPPGIQVDFILNNLEMFEYRDQFSVFNLNLFNCDVFEPEPFCGTLFRLPFRTVSSDISHTVYNNSTIGELKSRILKEAESCIRFLQHIKCIEIYEKPLTSEPVLLLKVSKNEITHPFESHETFLSENLAHFDEIISSPLVKPVVHHQKVSITCEKLLEKKSESFIISYSTGTHQCKVFLNGKSNRKISNYMPVASVALPVNSIGKSPAKKSKYNMYCYLPLPVTSPYPMYINGCFALDQSRRGIACTEDGSDKTTWNIALINDALVNAFINLFVQIQEDFSKGKYHISEFYRLWPLDAQPHSILWKEFPVAFATRIMNNNTPLFYYDLNDEWIGYDEANFIFYEDYYNLCSLEKFYNFARRKCLQLNIYLVDLEINLQSTHIFQIFMQNDQDKIFSLERICRDVIFPQFSTLSFCDIKLVLTSLLPVIHIKKSQNWVRELFSNTPCIPCGSRTDFSLLKPSNVISPHSPVVKLYHSSDKRTIHPNLVELFALKTEHLKALKLLHIIENTLPVSDLIERCECQIYFENPRRIEHCMIILKYLNNKTQLSVSGYKDRELKMINCKLLEINFIPVWNDVFLTKLGLQTYTEFASPSQCYSYSLRYLMSPNCYAVTEEVDNLKSIKTFLSISETKNSISIHTLSSLLQSLRDKEKQINSLNLQNDLSERAECIYTTIFDHRVKDPSVSIKTLEYIWHPVTKSFCHVTHLVCSEKYSHYKCKFLVTFPYKLTDKNLELRKSFLQNLGIKENISPEDAHRTLALIATEHSNTISSIRDKLLIDLIIELSNEFFVEYEEFKFSNNPKPVLLSSDLQLYPACKLLISDMPWEKIGHTSSENRSNLVVNKLIHPIAAFNLGAKSKRSKYYTCSEFEEFGQYEDIADRIRGLKRGFPCGTTILKELLQNAEDAGATEVAFILDTTNYSSRTNSLCLNQEEQPDWYKYQQYKSLLVYNNSAFSEEDLKGIQSVGLGGKQDRHTIGKFGLGFNAVYHLTDSPCLLTRRNIGGQISFCIFDPFRKFLKLKPQSLPGMKFKFKSEDIHQFPDQFIPYSLDSLNTTAESPFPTLTNGDYTIFRIPIMDNNIESKVEGILSDFLKNSSNFNLFLDNIQRISIYRRDKHNTTMMGTFTILVTPQTQNPPPVSLNCKYLNTIQISKREIIHGKDISQNIFQQQVSILGKRNRRDSHTSSWLLFTHKGSMRDLEKCSPAITKYRSIYEREKLTHQVYGGVAVHIPADTRYSPPTGGSCLYSYLPIGDDRSVNFPILINAPFILEPERQHIRFRDVSGYSPGKLEWEDVWHSSIIQHVIGPLFASLLIYLRLRANTALTKLSHCTDSNYYDWYYSLYPDIDKLIQGNQVYTNFLYALCKQLYTLMYRSNEEILISQSYECLHCLHGVHSGIFPDRSRSFPSISHKLIYSSTASKSRKQSSEEDTLYLTLNKLKFPLTGAPDHIDTSFRKFSCNLTRLDQTILLSFLNRIKCTALNALVLNMKEIGILVEYLFSAKPEIIKFFHEIPLKIDFTRKLGDFSRTRPTYTPKFASLLPHCADMFVSSTFPSYSISILCNHGFMQEMPPEYLSKNLVAKEFQLQECHLFWEFILQSGLQSFDLIQNFGRYALVPIKNNSTGEYTVISNLPAILNESANTSNKGLYGSLIKLKCFELCLDILARDNFSVSTLAKYLQPLTISSTITFHLFISAVKLSDISIECVSFDLSEAIALRNLLPSGDLHQLKREEIKIISLLKIFVSHQNVLCYIAQFNNCFIHNSAYNIGPILTNKLTQDKITIFKTSKKEETLIKHIADSLRLLMLTERDFFLVYVLRYFTQLNINEQKDLLLFIQNNVTSYKMDFIDKLKSVKFIHRNRLVSDCYSPEIQLFKIFFSADLLPNEWSSTNREYSQIFRNLGLHDKADLESILTAAQRIGSRKFIYTSSDIHVPLSALAQVISDGIHLNIHNITLLQQLSTIDFLPVWKHIPNSSAMTQEISSFNKAELCNFQYSCCVATHIHDTLVSKCYTLGDNTPAFYLNIRSKPDIQTVITHLEMICNNFNEILTHHRSIIYKLFIDTYGFLQENCSQSLKNKFAKTKCIYYENKLFYPRNIVFSLDTIILEYLFKVPDALKRYHGFLKLVGVSESADYSHFAAVMTDICLDMSLSNEKRKEISKTTFQLFISTLRKAEQSGCIIIIDPQNIMVLSDNYEIVPIPNVVYIDNTRLKIHVGNFPNLSNLQFLLELPPNSLGSCEPPVSLKIKHLSQIISETLDPALKNAGTVSRYRNECREIDYLLKCREFAKGLIRIYYHFNIADGKGNLDLIRIKNDSVKDISKEPGIQHDPQYLTCFQILQKLSIRIVSTLSMQITEVAVGAAIAKDGIYDCFIENSVLYANGRNIKNVSFFNDLTYALNLHFGNIFSDMLFALQLCLSCDNTCDIMKKLDSFNIQACPFIDDIILPSSPVNPSTSFVMRTTPQSSSRVTPNSTLPPAASIKRPAGVTRATLLQIIHTPPIRLISNTRPVVISNEDKFIAKLWIRTAQCDLRAAKKLVCEETDGAVFPPHACSNCFECAMKTCIAILYINKYNEANISCQRNLDILLDIVKIFFKSIIAYNNFSSLCVSLINFDENAKNPLMTPGIGCCIPMEYISVATAREAIKNASGILEIVKSEFPTFNKLMFSEDDTIWIQPTAQSLMMTQIESFQLSSTLTNEELSSDSDEYSAVARNFMNTLPNATIMSVLKIHHKTCWDNFVKAIKRKVECQDGLDGSPNFRENTLLIKPLFHGSSGTDPEVIIQDPVGFNVRYANEGMWGKGIYFAQNASYSHDFAYKDSTGICSMFLSKVFVGNARFEGINHELRGPPPGYHSVTGTHPAGTKVYILYENGLAYPGYLINYKPGLCMPS